MDFGQTERQAWLTNVLMNSQTSNEMKKEYIKPEIEIEIIETDQLLAASET